MVDRREVDQRHRQLIRAGRHVLEYVVTRGVGHGFDRLAGHWTQLDGDPGKRAARFVLDAATDLSVAGLREDGMGTHESEKGNDSETTNHQMGSCRVWQRAQNRS